MLWEDSLELGVSKVLSVGLEDVMLIKTPKHATFSQLSLC